jgi:hypothetical protein
MRQRWHGYIPGMMHAVTIYAPDKAQAKSELRKQGGHLKLPRGSSVWLAK